jgi:Fe2+ transport system protein FeoA
VRAGDSLLLRINDREVQSTVRALVDAGDERSRLLELRVALPENGFTVGQPLRVALPTALAKQVLAVPRDALVLRRDGASVYRITADNKAERVVVQLGMASGDLVEVIGGLQPGDRVVIRGGERLRPGAAVQILDAPATGAAKAAAPNGN